MPRNISARPLTFKYQGMVTRKIMENIPEKRGRGRPKGSRNKATRDIQELARPYAPEALKTLALIMRKGESEQARVKAADTLLSRGYGTPHQTVNANVNTTLVARMPLPAEDTQDWIQSHGPH